MSYVELVESDAAKCTGCGICELVCSFYHEGVCVPSLSAIRLIREEQKWYRLEVSSPFRIQICKQCPSPLPCQEACPADALVRNADIDAISPDHSKCIGCGICVEACPYHGIWYNTQTEKIIKCDMCKGHPECVNWCPTGVLKYAEQSRG